MAKPKRVAITVAGNTFYGREALQGMIQYRTEHANWQVHYEGITDPAGLKRTAMAVMDWQADGILIQLTDRELGQVIRQRGIPAIDIANHFQNELTTVVMDSALAGRMIARFFLDRGFKHLAFCGYDQNYSHYAMLRNSGFSDAAAEAGASCDVYHEHFPKEPNDWMQDLAQLEQWIGALPRPVGVMVCHDYRAHDVLWACKNCNLAVPEQVAVVGVGNDAVDCSITSPPLASLAEPARQIGYRAAELLDRMLEGETPPAQPVLIPPLEVVVRRSADIMAVEDADVASALQFISAHGTEPITVKDVLQAVPVSRRLIERKFLRYLGKTPRQLILASHIEHAKRLLAETHLKIPIIATRSGFSEFQVFSKLFKQVVGTSPSEFRSRWQHEHKA